MTAQKNLKEFESNLTKLENIVTQLEGGEMSLEQSISQFEQGIKLYKECRSALESVENKVKVLTDALKEIDQKDQ